MKLKTVEIEGKRYAEVDADGRVLYDNAGKEFAFDAAQTYGKIQELTGEAKSHREAKEAADAKLKELGSKLEGVDLSKMVDAGKLEEVKAEVAKSYQRQLDEERQAREKLESQYNSEKLTGAFASSKFINDSLAVPPDMALSTFGKNFKIEGGKLMAVDADGNTIYSRKNPGAPADFDEAISQIIENYPYKDRILKASNHSGTGGEGGEGGQRKTVQRADFDSMTPQQRGEVAKAVQEGKAAIVE